MSQHTLEERVAALERQVAHSQSNGIHGKASKDWRRTIGMFSGDEVMKQIEKAGRKIRQSGRPQARIHRKRKCRAKT